MIAAGERGESGQEHLGALPGFDDAQQPAEHRGAGHHREYRRRRDRHRRHVHTVGDEGSDETAGEGADTACGGNLQPHL